MLQSLRLSDGDGIRYLWLKRQCDIYNLPFPGSIEEKENRLSPEWPSSSLTWWWRSSIFHMLVARSITEHDTTVCLSHRLLPVTLCAFSFSHYCLQTQMIVYFYMWVYMRERTCMFGCTRICVCTEVNLRVIPRVLVTWFFESLMRVSGSLISLDTSKVLWASCLCIASTRIIKTYHKQCSAFYGC